MLKQEFKDRIEALVGKDRCSFAPEDLIIYSYDANAEKRAMPEGVVSPETTEEVAAILKLANEYEVPVVPRGGASCYTGGVVPVCGGMILARSADVADVEKRFNSQIFPGIQGGPLMHVIAAKAVAFGEALRPQFKTYQQQVLRNAEKLASCIMDAGYELVSGGTDNHLMLMDLTRKDITGKDAEHALDVAGITVNKNTVPFETRSPFVTSGVRLGTPALTTRGMKEEEMEKVAGWIVDVLAHYQDERYLDAVCRDVRKFAEQFPLFAW